MNDITIVNNSQGNQAVAAAASASSLCMVMKVDGKTESAYSLYDILLQWSTYES